MRPADEPLVKCVMTKSARGQAHDIIRRTRERLWQLYKRLIQAEWDRLDAEAPFHRSEEGLAE